MASQWYVLREGKERGPLTQQQLMNLAQRGQLQPHDLVRREDMMFPVEAHIISGLFPATDPDGASVPPKLPVRQAPVARVVQPPPLYPTPVPCEDAELARHEAPEPKTKKWTDLAKNRYVQVGVAILVVMGGVAKIASRSNKTKSAQEGTITFAEQVDPKTLRTTNEGTRFTTGWVWMVVRGKKPFGDTKLIFYAKEHGTEVWSVVGEETVDPAWDVVVWKELMDVPGTLDIKVVNGKGDMVAQSTVQIVAK